MDKNVIIAPVGPYMDELFVGIREFPTKKVILISHDDFMDKALDTKKNLEKFKIPTEIKSIKGNLWEETFKAVSEIKNAEKDSNLLINVSTGDRDNRCAATSAAFVNGIRAFGVDDKGLMMLPVLKFNYYNMITEKKMQILRLLNNPNCCASLEDLSKKSKMSLPLISYHINGNLKSEGLKQLGLVETQEKKGRVEVHLTTLGKMLLKGYIH